MDVQKAIISRRTIHSFSQKQASEESIERAIQAANYAPCHRLTFPWRFTSLGREKRKLLFQLALEIQSSGNQTNEKFKEKLSEKIINPSHLLVASQISADDPKLIKEDYAACSCAIQNLMLSLVSDGIGSKWSTGKLTTDKHTYKIVGINPIKEEIIGFIWIGYGDIPPTVNRPPLNSIFRRF